MRSSPGAGSVLDLASRLFGRQKNHDTGEALFRCPDCDRDKLYVNGRSGAFFCPRCEYKGNVLRMRGQARDYPIEPDPIRIVVPPTLQDVNARPLFSAALITYMLNRGFTERQLYDLQIQESDFVGRVFLHVVDEFGDTVDTIRKWINLQGGIIFPIYDNGYRGYQTRYIYAVEKAKRWMSAPGVKRKQLIFNADRAFAPEHDHFFVAEGIPAACAFGDHGVATFGKGFTDVQLERLCGAPQQTIYVAYDGDAQKESHRLGSMLAETGKRVLVVPLHGDEDPDTVHDLPGRIKQAVPPDPYYEVDLVADFHTSYRRKRAPKRQYQRVTSYRPKRGRRR